MRPRINAPNVLVIDINGENKGIMPTREAISVAREAGLDLIQVGAKDNIPVCKVMDYGRWKYDQSKRDKKKKQAQSIMKEVKFRPNTGLNDLKYRAKQVDKFLREGSKVKLVVRFRGRELEHMYDTGRDLLEKFLEILEVSFNMEGEALAEGKTISLMVKPDK